MNRIKELRESKGMTQVRLSIELEVSQETVSAYEKGNYYPSVDVLLKMSDIFDSSIDYILGLSDIKRPFSSAELSADDLNIISSYRSLPSHKKAMVQAYIQGLSDSGK